MIRIERLIQESVSPGALDEINALLPQLKPSWPPLTHRELSEVLASPTRVHVALVRGTIVGVTLTVPHRHFAGLRYHVEDVVVDVNHRGRGVARALLEAAMNDAPDEVVSFDLRSHHSRVAAHRLYVSLGFEASDTTVFRKIR